METKTLNNLTNKQDKEIKKISLELFKLKLKFKQAEQEYNKQKEELQNQVIKYIKKKKLDSFGYVSRNHNYKFTLVSPKTIIWDIEALEKNIDKEILSEIVNKTYVISNFNGLVEMLKSYGVSPKEFKKYIQVDKKVNQKVLNELSELGEITPEQIEGCYMIQEGTEYVKITDTELNEDDE